MPKINGLLKIFIVLLLTFSMTGFICDDESDDKNSCSDAAKNVIGVYMDEGVSQADMCQELYLEIDYWGISDRDECNAKLYPDEYKAFAISELAEWCKYDDWTQGDIDCTAECDSSAECDGC